MKACIPSFSFLREQRGSALIISLIILFVLLLLGGAALKLANTETQISWTDLAAKRAFQAAEAANVYEAAMLRNYLNGSLSLNPPVTTINADISEPSLPGHSLEETSPIQRVGSPQQRNATGRFSGLTAFCQRYTITTTAVSNDSRARVKLVRLVEDQLIPLFQFGVFYQDRLEIFPGANMTFTGWIHSNANIRLGTHATLTVNQKMTAAGTITHYAPGTHHDQYFSGTVNVARQTEGIYPLKLPLPKDVDPVQMIQRCSNQSECNPSGSESYRLVAKSGLRIIDGKAYDKNWNVIDLSSCGANNPIESAATFYDQREKKTVTATQINLGKLKNCPAAYNALNDPPPPRRSGNPLCLAL